MTNWTLKLFKGQIRRKASKSASSVGSCSSATDSCSTTIGKTITKPEPLPKPQASPSSAASSGRKLLWSVPEETPAQKLLKLGTKGRLPSHCSKMAASKGEKIERILNKDKNQFKETKLNPKEFGYFQPEISLKVGGQSLVKETKEHSVERSGSVANVSSPGDHSSTTPSVKTAPVLGVPVADDRSSNSSSNTFMLDLKCH